MRQKEKKAEKFDRRKSLSLSSIERNENRSEEKKIVLAQSFDAVYSFVD